LRVVGDAAKSLAGRSAARRVVLDELPGRVLVETMALQRAVVSLIKPEDDELGDR
jgi:hypothetical protein